MKKRALIIIDMQNDYFPGGNYPLWNTENVLNKTEKLIKIFKDRNEPVILVQHIANADLGISPFFNKGTSGAEIHDKIKSVSGNSIIVTKEFADSFEKTNLYDELSKLGIEEIIICGMMTQNCVTHTAISKKAERYKVTVVTDCTTTVDELLHQIALHALSTRVKLIDSDTLIQS